MRKIWVLVIGLFLWSCSDGIQDFNTIEIKEDFSHISNPKERWEAYGLSDYSITQTRSCECLEPYKWTIYISQNTVVRVDYSAPKKEGYVISDEKQKEIEELIKNQISMTVDQAFHLIEENEETAASIRVTYDERFGYPIDLFIDYDAQMADEELIYSFSDLRKIE